MWLAYFIHFFFASHTQHMCCDMPCCLVGDIDIAGCCP